MTSATVKLIATAIYFGGGMALAVTYWETRCETS